MAIKYVHTNIIAKDWQALAKFYIDVFECKLCGPQRDLLGEWVEQMTTVKGCKIKEVHLSLPGYEGRGQHLKYSLMSHKEKIMQP